MEGGYYLPIDGRNLSLEGTASVRRTLLAALAVLFAGSAAHVSAEEPLPSAPAIFTISNDDCVSVDADGEPWQECGFQSFAMKEDGSRVLTVSARGVVQLWDERGQQLQKLDWSDQPGGASGYPDARTLIVGSYAIAVVHQNQIVILDLASGAVRSQRATDAMFIDRLARFGEDRAFVGFALWDWHGRQAAELILPDGELREVPALDDLRRTGPDYWVSGRSAPFALHRLPSLDATLPLERSCMPINERYCSWRDIPGRMIHVLDVQQGRWQSFDVGRLLAGVDSVDVIPVDFTRFAIVCGRDAGAYPYPKQCVLRDLANARDIYAFQATRFRAAGVTGANNEPEVRVTAYAGADAKAVTLAILRNGTAYTLDPSGQTWMGVANGGLLLPESEGASYLVDGSGRKLAQLPFSARNCGNGWPSWTTNCRISSDGRRWLVAKRTLPASDPDDDVALTMFELPPVAK